MLATQWLKGSVGFELTDLNVSFILENRGVDETDDSSEMTEKQKDLSRADAYTIYLTSSNKGGVKIQDGSTSESTSGESFTYRQEAQRLAIFYYEKWGETIPDTTNDNVTSSPTYLW
jgi:hypothetical protein